MKIWLSFEEPKSVTMLRPLYEELIKEHEVFITARDFDSTYFLLDKWGVPYYKTGQYGGGSMIGKLKAYTNHVAELTEIVEKEKPEFLFCITSPEAIRVAFGLQLPNIMFNDEPRSFGCCALTLPYVDQVIVPKAIPIEWYTEKYSIKKEKIIRFNGIDEVGWLNQDVFKPDEQVIKDLNLEKEKYIICRTEPTQAVYLIDKMKPHETQLTELIPESLKITNDEVKYVIITRNQPQFDYMNKFFENEIQSDIVRVYSGVSNLSHVMYFSKMVWSGCGTMIREAALLGVPSISFWPMDTYPQEQFLMENGFPLKHTQELKKTIEAIKFYYSDYERENTFEKIDKLDNPLEIGIQEFKKRMKL